MDLELGQQGAGDGTAGIEGMGAQGIGKDGAAGLRLLRLYLIMLAKSPFPPPWIQHGLHLRAEGMDGTERVTQMKAELSSETKGRDSIQKSLRYLRHALIEPGPVEALRAEAIELFSSSKDPEKSRVLSWGLATACYPFLNAVAAVIGRMVRIQSEFKLEQLLRKLTETYGERETVRRSSRYSLGFIHDLGFLRRTKKAGGYQSGSSVTVGDPRLAGWFMKAWFSAEGIMIP